MVTHGQFHPAFKVKITLILHKLSQKLQKQEIHANLFYEGSITEILKIWKSITKGKNPQSFANQSQQHIKRKYIMLAYTMNSVCENQSTEFTILAQVKVNQMFN